MCENRKRTLEKNICIAELKEEKAKIDGNENEMKVRNKEKREESSIGRTLKR